MISYISVAFNPLDPKRPIHGRNITLNGYRGLLYRGVLEQANPRYRQWLHDHPAPKPFTLVPYYGDGGILAGVHFVAFNAETANILADSWQYAQYQELDLSLGRHRFRADNVQLFPSTDFQALAAVPPGHEMGLEFASPTYYKQGEEALPLPLPRNIFMRPMAVWNAFAQPGLEIPHDWLAWVEKDVFITRHALQTVDIQYDRKTTLVGFVGEVALRAKRKSPERFVQIWQSLGHFLPLCGTGSRTTIGMGAVTRKG